MSQDNNTAAKNTIVSPKYGDSGHVTQEGYEFWLRMKKFGTLAQRFLMRRGLGD